MPNQQVSYLPLFNQAPSTAAAIGEVYNISAIETPRAALSKFPSRPHHYGFLAALVDIHPMESGEPTMFWILNSKATCGN
jgi:hypothetical protein